MDEKIKQKYRELNAKLTQSEKQWLKAFDKVPEDTIAYVTELFQELYLCYDYMVDVEQHTIVEREFQSKKEVNMRFLNLLAQNKLTIMVQAAKIDKSKKKSK